MLSVRIHKSDGVPRYGCSVGRPDRHFRVRAPDAPGTGPVTAQLQRLDSLSAHSHHGAVAVGPGGGFQLYVVVRILSSAQAQDLEVPLYHSPLRAAK